MALGQGSLAGVARVAFEAQTGEFNRDISVAEARYRQATQGMSDDAIRLELAQERLRRALAKGPTAYREIANAELNLRRVQSGLQVETDQLSRSFDRHGRSIDRFGRGALLGSGAFRGLARSITFASSAFLGGAGLVYGIKQAISVASNLEEQQNKVSVTFRDSAGEVLDWSRTSSTAMGIAQDQALSYVGTIGGILNSSGLARAESARLSQQIVQLASDMASFNNASPEETLQAIRSGLVGEIEPLRRFQVLLSEATVAQEALRQSGKASKEELTQGEKVLARYRLILKQTTDQQGDYARTADGTANSERTLQALWRDTQGIIGQTLLPSYTGVVQSLRDWLAEDENRLELQRNVNTLVSDATEIAKGFAGGLNAIQKELGPLIRLLGGLDRAVEAALILGIVLKARKAAASFGLIAAASSITRTKVIADAAAMSAALDAATRPRVVPISVTTTGIPGGGPTTGPTRGPSRLGTVLNVLGVAVVADILTGGRGAAAIERAATDEATASDQGNPRRVNGQWIGADGLPVADQRYWERLFRQGFIDAGGRRRSAAGNIPGADREDRAAKAKADAAAAAAEAAGGRGRRGFTFARFEARLAEIEEGALDAAATPGAADDARIERARLALARRALRELELTRDQRMKVKQERNRALSALAAIEAAEDQEAKRIADERASKREEARAAREAAEKKQQEADEAAVERQVKRAQRHFDRMEKLTKGRDFATRGGLRAAALRDLDKSGRPKAAGEEKDGLTLAEVRQMQFEFLQGLRGIQNQFGGNLFPPGAFEGLGQVAAHSFTQTELLREQNRMLGSLTSAAKHSGSRFAQNELAVAFDGMAF